MTEPECDIPVLSHAQRGRLLARIEASAPAVNMGGLTYLVRSWLLTMPFHNLDLLAGSLGDCRSLTRDQALERCEAGLGGPCHVQALGFAALLAACGFDATLCSATIGHEGDHLLVRASMPEGTFLCDVGNGQPYLTPFRLGVVTEVKHLGWRVCAEPVDAGIRLLRWSPDLPAGRVVYDATAEPRSWADFGDIIARHHSQPGFGPFMTGLRAVRIREARMDTLRDDQWTTYLRDGFTVQTVPQESMTRLLLDVFGLEGLPIASALQAWRRARREDAA